MEAVREGRSLAALINADDDEVCDIVPIYSVLNQSVPRVSLMQWATLDVVF